MKPTLLGAIASILLSAGTVSFAQEPPAQREPQQKNESPAVQVRGCLTKGSEPQQYVVADEESGKKVAFGAPSKIDSYLNQTVELTGRMIDRGGEKSFQPEAIKSVSSSCTKK